MTTLARALTPDSPRPARAASRDQIRAHFPALAGPTIFLDNAGGSQLPACVPAAMHRYMTEQYVQLNADYELSRRATATVRAAHAFAKAFVNALDDDGRADVLRGPGEVVLGPSTTALCHILAEAYARGLAAGTLKDPARTEIIVCTAGHEANVGCWLRLAQRGFTIRHWPAELDPADGVWRPRVSTLASMLSPRTRLVTFPQVSNILGEVMDVAGITKLVHDAGGRVVVDGVAYAPHHAPDVKAWKCDWYVWSWYKVFAPHAAGMYGSREAMAEIPAPNHEFLARDTTPYLFELGGANHESCAGLLGLYQYLKQVVGEGGDGASAAPDLGDQPFSRSIIERAFAHMHALEHESLRVLMSGLAARTDLTFYGPGYADAPAGSRPDTLPRVATVAFTLANRSSASVAKGLNAKNLAVRYGNFYSRRLCEQMGLNPADGVIRASLAHYTTPAEIQRLLEAMR